MLGRYFGLSYSVSRSPTASRPPLLLRLPPFFLLYSSYSSPFSFDFNFPSPFSPLVLFSFHHLFFLLPPSSSPSFVFILSFPLVSCLFLLFSRLVIFSLPPSPPLSSSSLYPLPSPPFPVSSCSSPSNSYFIPTSSSSRGSVSCRASEVLRKVSNDGSLINPETCN